MACDITTLLSGACDNGFDKIAQNEPLYRAIELQLLCEISEGGGGGSGSVLSGSGAPVADPGVSSAIYFDEDTGVQYNWYDGSWH